MRAPLTCTLPPEMACAANTRVLKNRTAHSHLSMRTRSATGALPAGSVAGDAGSESTSTPVAGLNGRYPCNRSVACTSAVRPRRVFQSPPSVKHYTAIMAGGDGSSRHQSPRSSRSVHPVEVCPVDREVDQRGHAEPAEETHERVRHATVYRDQQVLRITNGTHDAAERHGERKCEQPQTRLDTPLTRQPATGAGADRSGDRRMPPDPPTARRRPAAPGRRGSVPSP